MRQFKQLPAAAAALLLASTLFLVVLAGWHREITSRYPVSDLPYVDMKHIREQIERGNVGRTEALYYRKDYAGADTTEIR